MLHAESLTGGVPLDLTPWFVDSCSHVTVLKDFSDPGVLASEEELVSQENVSHGSDSHCQVCVFCFIMATLTGDHVHLGGAGILYL